MIADVEKARLTAGLTTAAERKARLGQFFTPPAIAEFMAGLFAPGVEDAYACRLLDAGAGIGSLSDAFLQRWLAGGFPCRRVEVDAFEIDDSLHPYLAETLGKYAQYPGVSVNIRSTDFVDAAADWLSGSFFARELPE